MNNKTNPTNILKITSMESPMKILNPQDFKEIHIDLVAPVANPSDVREAFEASCPEEWNFEKYEFRRDNYYSHYGNKYAPDLNHDWRFFQKGYDAAYNHKPAIVYDEPLPMHLVDKHFPDNIAAGDVAKAVDAFMKQARPNCAIEYHVNGTTSIKGDFNIHEAIQSAIKALTEKGAE